EGGFLLALWDIPGARRALTSAIRASLAKDALVPLVASLTLTALCDLAEGSFESGLAAMNDADRFYRQISEGRGRNPWGPWVRLPLTLQEQRWDEAREHLAGIPSLPWPAPHALVSLQIAEAAASEGPADLAAQVREELGCLLATRKTWRV
ncbi:MAG: hypothetical protein KC486_25545, partial [Myxococcales bacterium]|nr:hypothetical protein [Myxococcales bacterium]